MFKEGNLSLLWDRSINKDDISWLKTLHKKYSFLPCCQNLHTMLLRPVILDQKTCQQMQTVAFRVIKIAVDIFKSAQIETLCYAKENGINDRLLDFFIDDENLDLYAQLVARPDIIFDKDGNIKIIELNLDTALGGLVDCTVLPIEYLNSPSARKIKKISQLKFDSPLKEMTALLSNLWKSLDHYSEPRVALVEYEFDVLVNKLQAAILTKLGISTSYVKPWELKVKENKKGLYYENELIDITIRNFPIDVPQNDEEISALDTLLESYREKHSLHLPSEKLSVISDKKLFALIWENLKLLQEDDQIFVKNCIPRTMFLNKTTQHKYPELMVKDRWVLKKGLGHGGDGVIIGKDVLSDESWKDILADQVDSKKYIVQEFVEPAQIVLPFIKGDALYRQKVDLVFGQYVFGTCPGGILVRFKGSGAVGPINSSQGGGACFCLVEG